MDAPAPPPAGLKCYGLSPRPACRVLRYEAEKTCAAASAAAEERAKAPPSGRRHDAFLAYLDSVRHNEERWGLETMQVRVVWCKAHRLGCKRHAS